MTRDAVLVMRSNTRGAVAALLQLCCSSVAATIRECKPVRSNTRCEGLRDAHAIAYRGRNSCNIAATLLQQSRNSASRAIASDAHTRLHQRRLPAPLSLL